MAATSRPLHRLTEDQARFLSNALPTWAATVEGDAPDPERDEHLAMLAAIEAALDASLAAHEDLREMVVAASDLQSGDYIAGDAGGLVRITGAVEASEARPGETLVEIEVGTIYLDDDEQVTILRWMPEEGGLDDEDERCRAESCDDDLSDLEGYNGFCGNHADLIHAHDEGSHAVSEEGPQADCPVCRGENVD